MATVIKKTPDQHGHYRVIYNVDLSNYPSANWLHDPDFSGVTGVLSRYWKVGGSPEAVLEMTQGEKDAVDADGQDSANVPIAGTLAFEKNGKCKDKWLGFGAAKSSDLVPFVLPMPIKLSALSFTNMVDNVDTDVEIYRNGTKIYTWEIRDKRYAWKTQGMFTLTFDAGDRLGIFLKDQGDDPKQAIVVLHYTTLTHVVGEGWSSTL